MQNFMRWSIPIDVTLAQLLKSRVCHKLAGPIMHGLRWRDKSRCCGKICAFSAVSAIDGDISWRPWSCGDS